jgi:disulfide bond formation protein DsbB
MKKIIKLIENHHLYASWAIALSGMLGSLYFSEVAGIVPCILCWYQRIALYPLVIILMVGILRKDDKSAFYALPFSLIGLAIAVYHNLLVVHVIPESVAPCVQGISCVVQQFYLFGYITIPFMSLLAFIAITFLLITGHTFKKRRQKTI